MKSNSREEPPWWIDMDRRRPRKVATVLAIVACLFLAGWFALAVQPAWSRHGQTGNSTATLILPRTECNLGTVSQGDVLQAEFPITNAGSRRLVVLEQMEASCGQSPGLRQVVIAAGQSSELTVEVDTARWYGRVDHTVHYTTNDAKLPQFTLRVTANVESPASPNRQ
jgi:hypothetical protein